MSGVNTVFSACSVSEEDLASGFYNLYNDRGSVNLLREALKLVQN